MISLQNIYIQNFSENYFLTSSQAEFVLEKNTGCPRENSDKLFSVGVGEYVLKSNGDQRWEQL